MTVPSDDQLQSQREYTKHHAKWKQAQTYIKQWNRNIINIVIVVEITSVPLLKTLINIKRFLTLEDGTDRLSRNVGKELPLHVA
jgi:hypothetical protein